MYRKRVRRVPRRRSQLSRNKWQRAGKVCPNAAGLRSRCLEPSALKWLAVGPRKGKGRIRSTTLVSVNIHVSVLPPARGGRRCPRSESCHGAHAPWSCWHFGPRTVRNGVLRGLLLGLSPVRSLGQASVCRTNGIWRMFPCDVEIICVARGR